VPDHAPSHSNLGAVKMRHGDMRGAVAAYRLALKYRPEWWDVARLLALVAATSEDPELRAPAEGVRLAQEAVRLAPAARRPAVIAVLAVAYGEAGNRELAEANARQAISMATAQGNRELVNDIVSRMRKYLPELATTPAEK